MFSLYNGAAGVTQAVDVGRPLTTSGKTVRSFTDSVTFDIQGRARDRLSLATMLMCTNDGFLGLDAVRLPHMGSQTLFLVGWDAGRENNSEKSGDIVDPCGALGPVPLAGDPNGNRDVEVATVTPALIQLHPGDQGYRRSQPGDARLDRSGCESNDYPLDRAQDDENDGDD